jgi:hypothetical protein
MVRDHPVNPVPGRGHTPDEVAASYDDAHLHAEFAYFMDLPRNASGDLRIDSETLGAHQGFSAELQQDAMKSGITHTIKRKLETERSKLENRNWRIETGNSI